MIGQTHSDSPAAAAANTVDVVAPSNGNGIAIPMEVSSPPQQQQQQHQQAPSDEEGEAVSNILPSDDDISSLPYGTSLQDNNMIHRSHPNYRHARAAATGAAGGEDTIILEKGEEAFDPYEEELYQLRAIRRRNILIIVVLLVFLGLVVAISVGIGFAVVANKNSKSGENGGDSNALIGEGGGGTSSVMPSSYPSYSGPCIPIEFGIIFDQYPEETGWFLVKGSTYDPDNASTSSTLEEKDAMILWSSKYYDPLDYAEHSDTFHNCFMPGTYTFVITDTEADGVCCYHGQGSYILTSEGKIIAIGGEMDSSEQIITFELPFEEPEPVDTDGDGYDDRLGWMMPFNSSNLTEGVDCENFRLVILTDEYGIETTWELYEGIDKAGTMIANGGPYGSEFTYVVDYCLPSPREYVLYVYDWDRRGLCCASGEGMYKISSGDILIYESDGQFGEVNITQFTLPADGSTMLLTDEPITFLPSMYPTTLSPAPTATLRTRPPKVPTISPSELPK